MARFYVPLDVNYQMDDKLMCAGPLAECIYVRALAYSKRATTEGRIRQAHLRVLGAGIRHAEKHVAALVEVGLWDPTEDGWYIVGWLNHNLSNDALTEEKARKRALSIAGNHKRHHVARGIKDDDCELCSPPVREQEHLPQSSRTGTRTPPITVAREDEQNRTEDEDEQKRKESSSSESDLQPPANKPEAEEEDLISKALTIVAEKVTKLNNASDPFRYRQSIIDDPARRADLERIHGEHDAWNAEQIAAYHGGRDLARVNAMTEPDIEPQPIPVSTYEPPPPVPPAAVVYCEGCNRPAAMMRALHCKLDPKPDHCADVATVRQLRPETA